MLEALAVTARVPLIGLCFGYGMAARTLVCVLIAAFPIITNTHFGLQSVDRASTTCSHSAGHPDEIAW